MPIGICYEPTKLLMALETNDHLLLELLRRHGPPLLLRLTRTPTEVQGAVFGIHGNVGFGPALIGIEPVAREQLSNGSIVFQLQEPIFQELDAILEFVHRA